ncbi:MAG: uncharacterized protein KVP18_001405 [Porospora cf. gigantea A]|uniref:uncharacterized protein n=1 Tax=Porospora cf. gigantea A TaxID=2853593 RepID=UPI003559B882|nr:MAG: hypothetical protein KVP18_001405 [Porospora cf. gigantea A]
MSKRLDSMSNDDFQRTRSESTGSSACSLKRSVSWKASVTEAWKTDTATTVHQRLTNYLSYFKPSPLSMQHVFKTLTSEVLIGIQQNSLPFEESGCSLRMLDVKLRDLPTTLADGIVYSLAISGRLARVSRISVVNGKTESESVTRSLVDASEHPMGLLDAKATAMELFDYLALLVKELVDKHEDEGRPLVFSFGYPLEHQSTRSATLVAWHGAGGFVTGRDTNDKVEGADIGLLLECAFWRHEVSVELVVLTNEACVSLVGASVQTSTPRCAVGVVADLGFNACLLHNGVILNTEVGNFNVDLPATDVDLEIDWANPNRDTQMLEKMVSANYLGEICRRSVIKVWQSAAPSLVWARDSLPTSAAAHIIMDDTPDLNISRKILNHAWEWEASLSDLADMKELFEVIFDRSAGLTAVVIAVLATKTGLLQAALGGLTVSLHGSLFAMNNFFKDRVHHYLRQLLGNRYEYLHVTSFEKCLAVGGAALALHYQK